MNAEWRKDCRTNKDRTLYMYRNNLLTDCCFVVGDREEKKVFRAHKFVLTQVSAVFETMFHGSVGQDTENIRIPDVDPGVFQTFLNAIYSEEVAPRSFKEACSLLDLTYKYMIDWMKDEALSYMALNINPSTAAAGFQVLSLYGHTDLASSCWKVIQEETGKVLTSEDFTVLGKETLVRILDEDRLNVESEGELVSAMERWIDADLQRQGLTEETDKLSLLSEFLPYIRFISMSVKEFLSFPLRTSLLSYHDSDSILNKILDPESPAILPPNISSKKRIFLSKVLPLPEDWKQQLGRASIQGDVGTLRRLQAAGADLSVSEDVTLLHFASITGGAECLRWLLEQGLSTHSTDSTGMTPLHWAAGYEEMQTGFGWLRLLNCNIPVVTSSMIPEIMRLLLDSGADPAARNSDGVTPLHFAAGCGSLETLRLLLDSGADPATSTSDGVTPLHIAAECGSLDRVRLLLDSGADPAARTSDGVTPLHSATERGSLETVRLLLDSGADPAARNSDGVTPLHNAAKCGSLETVRLLLDSGADPAARTSSGRTARDFATSSDHADVADLLGRLGQFWF